MMNSYKKDHGMFFGMLLIAFMLGGSVTNAIAGGSGTVDLSIKDTASAIIAGASITYSATSGTVSPASPAVGTVTFTWPTSAPDATFSAPSISGYQFVRFDRINTAASVTANPYTFAISNNDAFTLTAVYKKVVTASASFSSTPAGAASGTFSSNPAGPFDINTTPTFTVTSPNNWLVSTVKVDASTGTAMTLSCTPSGTNNSCTFSYNVGTASHVFYVAMLPYDSPASVGAPTGAVTSTTVGVTNNISDPDGVQNVTYYIYSNSTGTAQVASNTTGSFSGLSPTTDYWIKTTAEAKNATSGAWVLKESTLVKVTTSTPNYSIVLSIASGSGSVTVNGIASTPPVTTLVGSSQSVTYTFTADLNYVLNDVKVNGVSQGPVTPLTVSNILANKTVDVYFKRVWTIAVNAGANGSISPANPAKVVDGGSQTFTITPASGASIVDVLVDNVSQGAITTYTFTNVTEDHTIAATFEIISSDTGKFSITPPFIATRIMPNLLLMFDNSASMYDLANFDSTIDPATGRLKYFCYDPSYSDASTYDGYFNRTAIYSYNSTDNKFVSGATLPNSCTFKTAYLCVNMVDDGSGGKTTTTFMGSGNFLNWLTASKFDVQKKVLTGGKYNPTYNVLEAESRGCAGRRYIKEIPTIVDSTGAKLSFVVRGPASNDPDFINQSTQGGGTRIEIYRSTSGYNTTSCKAAADDWVAGDSMGTFQGDSTDCLGTGSSALKTAAYNDIVHLCYRGINDSNFTSNLNALQGKCVDIYKDATLGYNNDPSRITNENAADAVCASTLKHADFGNGNDIGFLGRCFLYDATASGNGKWKWDVDAGKAANCSVVEIMDYCGGTTAFDVIDPSSTATTTAGAPLAAPAFLMDAGANALGKITGTFLVRVALTAEPRGLIQDYKDYIIFGAMQFNFDGAGSECNDGSSNTTSPIKCAKVCSGTSTQCYVDGDCAAGVSCVLATKTDGGKIIAYNGYDPVGDHSTGLVHNIDIMTASTWTPWAEAYYNAMGYFANSSSIRLQAGDFDLTKNPSSLVCRPNNILIISDGGSTGDQKDTVQALVNAYPVTGIGSQTGACPGFKGSKNLDNLAWLAKNRKLTNLAAAPANPNETITTYTLFTGKEDATQTGECEPKTLMANTATNGGTTPYVADGGSAFHDKLDEVFKKIASSSSSGTAASILSNSGSSGANLLQAVFFPKKDYLDNTSVAWAGELQNLWYYVDPFFSGSTIHEDSDWNPLTDTTHTFDTARDKIIHFFFDPISKQTMVKRYNFDGTTENVVPDDPVNGLKSIWSAGQLLWQRAASDRKIFTLLNGVNFDLTTTNYDNLSAANKTIMRNRLKAEGADAAAQNTFSDKVIDYVRGVDVCLDSSSPCTNPSRSRTVSILQSDNSHISHVWKLGDIVSSTPIIQGNLPLSSYDLAWPLGYNDSSYKDYYNSPNYKKRGMVYVGANDGMLHAFRLGTLTQFNRGTVKGTFTGQNLGKEEWAFAPRHVLPYLKLLMQPDYALNHTFYVDGANVLYDVATNATSGRSDYWNEPKTASSWKTMLVGGMGLGGACRSSGATCVAGSSTGTCVKSMSNDWGYSSYFALDLTDQHYNTVGDTLAAPTPTVKWEFNRMSDGNDLGFATTGPALVRINAKKVDGTDDTSKNGRWLAVFASGPTGPIDNPSKQFYGKSDQNLKIFVVDLEKGPTTGNYWVIDTGIPYAFGGSITNNVVADTEMPTKGAVHQYQDDVVYIGYVRNSESNGSGTWTQGGIVRMLIPDTANPDTLDPNGSADVAQKWNVSQVIDGIGPVTTSVAKLMSAKNLYLFFGSGRYFYRDDNQTTQDRLYMVKDLCFPIKDNAGHFVRSDIKSDCSIAALTLFDLTDRTSGATDTSVDNGWYIDLDGGERVVTDTVATTNGSVFYTSFKPSTNPCRFGGTSYLWGLKYDSGYQLPAAAKKGKALIQLSTGAFAEVDLSAALADKNGRRTGEAGSPSATSGADGGISDGGKAAANAGLIMTPAGLAPVKRILHIQERYK